MTLAPWTGSETAALTDARAARRTLRAEKAHLLHWRRLVRGRLDLAIAAFAPPPPLGEMGWDLVPEAQLSLPVTRELAGALDLDGTADALAVMERLRELDRVLAAYGAALDAALEQTMEHEVHHLARAGVRSTVRSATPLRAGLPGAERTPSTAPPR